MSPQKGKPSASRIPGAGDRDGSCRTWSTTIRVPSSESLSVRRLCLSPAWQAPPRAAPWQEDTDSRLLQLDSRGRGGVHAISHTEEGGGGERGSGRCSRGKDGERKANAEMAYLTFLLCTQAPRDIQLCHLHRKVPEAARGGPQGQSLGAPLSVSPAADPGCTFFS